MPSPITTGFRARTHARALALISARIYLHARVSHVLAANSATRTDNRVAVRVGARFVSKGMRNGEREGDEPCAGLMKSN